MLQNRVDPFGNIINTPERGAWMGNRGVIHNDKKEIVRSYKLNTWITCLLEFKGKHREVMAPKRYTELFFMDEATAFSAGHRPCAECRRDDFNRFKQAWLLANPEYSFTGKTPISEIDEIIHAERLDRDKNKRSYQALPEDLPDGTFIAFNDKPYLIKGNSIFQWSPGGYGPAIAIPLIKQVKVLTPPSIVKTFKAGYSPQMSI